MIELTGVVPAGWTSARIDSLVRHRNQFGDLSLPLLGVSVRHGVVRRDGNEGRAASEDLGGYRVVRTGDLVVNKLVARDGAFGRAHEDGLVSPAYWVLVLEEGADVRFLDYSLRSAPGLASIRRLSKDMPPAQFDWPWPSAKAMRISLAPVALQVAIADFLDRECARIDELVEGLEGLLGATGQAIRSEQEQELLGHAAAYERTKLGWHVALLSGYAFASDDFSDDPGEGVRLLRGTNIAPGRTRWDDVVYWPHEQVPALSRFALREGDVVLGLDRPWIKAGLRVAQLSSRDLPALLLQRVCCLRARTDAIDVRYVQAWLEVDEFRDTLSTETTGVSVPHISAEQVKAYKIAVPPPDVQAAFLKTRDARRGRFERLATEVELMRASLDKYRDALITEAVTGKLDVTAASEARMSDNLAAVSEGADPEVLA